MPTPVSATEISAMPSFIAARTSIRPPSGVKAERIAYGVLAEPHARNPAEDMVGSGRAGRARRANRRPPQQAKVTSPIREASPGLAGGSEYCDAARPSAL